MTKILETTLACLVTFVTLGAAHFLCTWRLVLGQRVKPPWTYVVGVLMLVSPWASLMWLWEYDLLEVVGSLAAVVVSGGIAVGGGYLLLNMVLLEDENRKWRALFERILGGEDDDEEGKTAGS